MAMPAGYKPSPLGYGSPRSSPFRRPESPSSPSPGSRQITPTPSPTKPASLFTPSRFDGASVPSRFDSSPTPTPTQDSHSRIPSRFTPSESMAPSHVSPSSPVRSASHTLATSHQSLGHGNALSQLQPAQVRILRDGFQIMDRDSDGVVNREDVVDMLAQLGLPTNPTDVSQFFPPGGPQTLTLAAFLNSIATSLAALSPASELLSAFSAFDDDDSGQVDLAELREALLRTAPEPGERAPTPAEVDRIVAGFSGRRAFSKSTMGGGAGGSLGGPRRGEVFRYQEFVHSIMGANGASESSPDESRQE
ncbi:putative myosin regulatory light chain 1 [Rosellinia necatrix]|uniref:Putative myosin regulatory light chain 1 n=1 Tax=Rosellinia necatrix TaxID=77044 RepID=A0A1W2THZ0_ROSNE|nr:putative myosin regulatory light chain 1 [Rosellinia necatrix]